MTFQAYLDNIKAKTGHTPDDFRALARRAGLLTPELRASDLVAWLKKDFDLGHGHAMAIWASFKAKGWVEAPTKLIAAAAGRSTAKAKPKPVAKAKKK
ncbi:DUF4287 domain-containing protein [Bradyrhizobium sp. 2TAF24]|uniref:DUF4287 domain-containing protein n=1 Tax=Bradyrhizobium sp. 2TAF24 TaxID=3233011 RepID=UPI003F92221C